MASCKCSLVHCCSTSKRDVLHDVCGAAVGEKELERGKKMVSELFDSNDSTAPSSLTALRLHLTLPVKESHVVRDQEGEVIHSFPLE